MKDSTPAPGAGVQIVMIAFSTCYFRAISLKDGKKMSRRVCYALDLVDDANLIAEYERAHAPEAVWPEVTDVIRTKGFLDMEIWRAADRLFMIATVADDFPRALTAEQGAADARWEAVMSRFQRPLPHAEAGEKWLPMFRIYSLNEQITST